MKSAIELLNDPSVSLTDGQLETLELVAKRAREEMREAAWREADCFADNSSTARHIKRAIQSLPVEAAK